MNTDTGQIVSMTDEEAKTAKGNWVPYKVIRLDPNIAFQKANRSKYKPHVGKKQLSKINDSI